jgi:hypothetical protein
MKIWLQNPLLLWCLGWVIFFVALALIGSSLKARSDRPPTRGQIINIVATR